ncbi:5-formyltetrahydrofolate cyclo-ligase [Brumimicrobium salinarum]|uniref:5-formyltetrahydrofolate cyclo-ligase n=1 Tax=Brumimicrobium salinarum TaxID=2058658 RepID=A0A2I0R201_9FLAO|nr:5-formyltetrahydrofolate cyclo-ligase [Brumimicrobium salinarum]PKR80589.1 5-formyltetrahydrofolate cyclo-ligase [Brumimicrobium salinarum]
MTKDEIRNHYRALRKELSPEQCIYYSQQITNNFLRAWNFNNQLIHCFLPIHRLKEVDTVPLIKRLKRNNKICIPVSNFDKNNMTHKLLNEHTQFQDNAYGIPEPVSGEDVNVEDIQVVIIPLLAADQHGNRLGYGKGFYDRFLTQCSPDTVLIGLTMFDIHEDLEDMGAHDVPLHYVVTPKGIIKTEHAQ